MIDDENYDPNMEEVSAPSKGRGRSKTVEETYQKKTQLEHILLRPDTYIGSTEKYTSPMHVLNPTTNRLETKDITYVPGLFKIFDEILVNASDNKQRDSNMDKLDVTIDPSANTISVMNNGKGIPIVMHKEHNVYVPELIFGFLLTGSNFDDDEKKTTGGRNGYGAKLANIFSTSFTVECCDVAAGLRFEMTWENNMSSKKAPKVKPCRASDKSDYVKITFSPDLAKFKMDCLDADIVSLFSKRAYDIAGAMTTAEGKRLKVSLNGKTIPVKKFEDYIGMYDDIEDPVAFEVVDGCDKRWQVGVAKSKSDSFEQISFVNSICTSKGGQHCNFIADQISKSLAGNTKIKKAGKGGKEIKPAQIKNQLCVFVNCLIENPAFDSQTKENLTTRSKDFGSKPKLSEAFFKKVGKSAIVEAIVAMSNFKANQALKNTGGKKKLKLTGISKLDDANHAGGAKSPDCTLILTEGDSAKSLAMSGLSVIGRDYYGVFPLKGKLLNVRDNGERIVVKNEEIKNIVEIMGLKFGTKYDADNIKTLRYGHLMIMADQDFDGSHIKGLVINFIHRFWPELLDVKGFLQQFITPIIKVSKGKRSRFFFTVPEYDGWREENNDGKGWTSKYY